MACTASIRSWICFLALSALPLAAQPEPPQFRKTIALSKRIAADVEKRDGALNDSAIVAYVQQIADRLAGVTNTESLEIHITRGNSAYAMPLAERSLYISATLFENFENESELAGLLAHELAHDPMPVQHSGATIPIVANACVLADDGHIAGWAASRREAELVATRAAMETLRKAGYEPSAVLDLFSRLSYNHPGWATALDADDILTLRVAEEARTLPPAGYAIDSSDFSRHRQDVMAAMGHRPRLIPSLLKSSASPMVR